MTQNREQVKRRRQVLEQIVEVVKVIGNRGLSYRKQQNDAAYSLDDESLDHGHFFGNN